MCKSLSLYPRCIFYTNNSPTRKQQVSLRVFETFSTSELRTSCGPAPLQMGRRHERTPGPSLSEFLQAQLNGPSPPAAHGAATPMPGKAVGIVGLLEKFLLLPPLSTPQFAKLFLPRHKDIIHLASFPSHCFKTCSTTRLYSPSFIPSPLSRISWRQGGWRECLSLLVQRKALL